MEPNLTNTDTVTDSYTLAQHIEAILFWKGDPMSVAALSKITSSEKNDVIQALAVLKESTQNRGIVLIEHDGEFTLGTNPSSARLIETVRTEELSKDLGKASLETLAIILYQSPIRRSEIDYIRGVNSNFILRNLLVRGLIERRTDAQDSRAAVYVPTLDLLRFLGITHVSELEDFSSVQDAIQSFRAGDNENETITDTQVEAIGTKTQEQNTDTTSDPEQLAQADGQEEELQ